MLLSMSRPVYLNLYISRNLYISIIEQLIFNNLNRKSFLTDFHLKDFDAQLCCRLQLGVARVAAAAAERHGSAELRAPGSRGPAAALHAPGSGGSQAKGKGEMEGRKEGKKTLDKEGRM